MSQPDSPAWTATYRLQLNHDFDFKALEETASYLSALHVSHAYLSPIVQASPGSTHGYDVVDPARISLDLGGATAYVAAALKLREFGLGQLLDIVPNHMAISSPENPWWWDVLENGQNSKYVGYFDFGWLDSLAETEQIRIPVLEDRYGKVLRAGKVRLGRVSRSFVVLYGDFIFPLSPATYTFVLEPAVERSENRDLAFLSRAFSQTQYLDAEEAAANREVLWRLLVRLEGDDPAVAEAIAYSMREINADIEKLHSLLRQQHYRLAYWRTADESISYRRFFNINTLIGVRVERDDVFRERHEAVVELVSGGVISGLRIDHIDGLRDPEAYLARLRSYMPNAKVVVEKILAKEEELPDSWQCDGTTGYDFLNVVNGLFVNPKAERALTECYQRFSGELRDYSDVLRQEKRRVLHELFTSELHDLTRLLVRISEGQIDTLDWPRADIELALQELIAAMPVYRTYVQPDRDHLDPHDREIIETSLKLAILAAPHVDPDLFGFLSDLLLLKHKGELETEFVLRLQQLTGPAMAKGAEDTTFYSYNRLISLNEVGGEPSTFGLSLEAFHAYCARVAERWPGTLLATSTHDTKRGEDVRLRIDAISEQPEVWEKAVQGWSAINGHLRHGEWPDANTEYYLYQTLVGAWPIDEVRVQDSIRKAIREAKVHTSWASINEQYEAHVESFISGVLGNQEFIASLAGFLAKVEPGAQRSSLSQTLIKLTAPGVPDLYQGTELWDLSLVDPDNRRPVDFELRRRLLAESETLSSAEVMKRLEEGLPKLWLIRRALQLRRRRRDAFAGSYEPLCASGAMADHVVAFVRGGAVITIAPRLLRSLESGWYDTSLTIPAGRWQNVFTEASFDGGAVAIEHLLGDFPVALLERVAA